MPALRTAVRQQYPDAGYRGVSAATTGALTVTIVGGLISVGVWLALARRTRRGRPGVRVVSTVVFVIDSLTVLSTRSHGFLTPATWMTGAAEWAAGLIVIVFLWDRRSTAYFAELQRARKQASPQWGATAAAGDAAPQALTAPPPAGPDRTAGPDRASPGRIVYRVIPCTAL